MFLHYAIFTLNIIISLIVTLECYVKPGTKDECICPSTSLGPRFPAICHHKEPPRVVECTEHNGIKGSHCDCPMYETGTLYRVSCNKGPSEYQKKYTSDSEYIINDYL